MYYPTLGEIVDECSPTPRANTARNGMLVRMPMSNNRWTKTPKEEESVLECIFVKLCTYVRIKLWAGLST